MGNHQVKDNHENVKDDENDIMEDSGQSNEWIHLLDYCDVDDEWIVVSNGEIRNYFMIIIHTNFRSFGLP